MTLRIRRSVCATLVTAILVILLTSLPAQATLTGFVSSPAANSVNFTNQANFLGAEIDMLDFDGHPLAALDTNIFPGISLVGTGDFTAVQFSVGPGDPGGRAPQSSGEGTHGASNILGGSTPAGSLTATFDSPVLGVGLFTVDLFNPQGENPASLEAFDGPNGTGNSLGLFTAARFNFQQNKLYFMGLTSDISDIRSVVFTSTGGDGDALAIDELWVAQVPEPSSLALFGCALLGIVSRRSAVPTVVSGREQN